MTSRVDSEETRWFVKAYLKRLKGKKVHGSKQKTSLLSCLLIIWVWIMIGLEYKELTGPLNAKEATNSLTIDQGQYLWHSNLGK